MNGHTYLRTYRVLMFLGMASFLYTAFVLSVPADFETEEYVAFHAGAPRCDSSRTASTPPPSTLSSRECPPTTPRSTASTCTK